MTTPADELRTAAETLRELIGEATEAPWRTGWSEQQYELVGPSSVDPIAEWTYAIATWEPKASVQRAECDTADADYIAAMHPGVGTVLAELLDAAAGMAREYPELAHDHDRPACDDYACDVMGRSIALARKINGGQQ